jgi:hypothetical protein
VGAAIAGSSLGEIVKKSVFVVLMCAVVALPVAAQSTSSAAAQDSVAEKGKMLIAANGARLGAVYRVRPDGCPQLIIDGRMVTVPANTISMVDGKLTTSLSKSQVLQLH